MTRSNTVLDSTIPPSVHPTTSKKKREHFPGDPRFGIALSVEGEDISALREDEMLSTRLLDFLIQQAAPVPASEDAKQIPMQNRTTTYLASLGVQMYIQETVRLLEDQNRHSRKIQRIRASVEAFHDDKRSIIILPILEKAHFYVLVVQFAGYCRSFYERVHCYDSLRHSERASRTKIREGSHLQQFLLDFNSYVMNFIFHKREDLHQSPAILTNMLEYLPCPQQTNVIDCGLFAVGVVLHLLANVAVESKSFNQENVSHLRSLLATFLSSRGRRNKKAPIPSALIRNCFPLLKGSSIVDNCGVEIIDGSGVPTTAITQESFPSTTSKADVKKNNDSPGDHATPQSRTPGVLLSSSPPGTPQLDTAMEEILKQNNVNSFESLDDVIPMVNMYEQRTGNRLRIHRSERNKYRIYKCSEHVNCTFEILFGRRRSDGCFLLKRVNNKHSAMRGPSRAKDGRRWKERRAGKLTKVVLQVLKTKKDKPIPADIVKTAATMYGEVVPYFAAHRSLNTESKAASEAEKRSFQLLIPYLEPLKLANPGSIIEYVCNEDGSMKEFFVFPSFANDSLQVVRPMISLDAAHLKSKYKGTLFVATVLSTTNEIYPVGFMISAGNEDLATWTTMLTGLKKACPTITDEAAQEDEQAFYGERKPDFLRFTFISDRDKGLKGALRSVFPKNLEISCAKHIEANVSQKFGAKCGKLVVSLAKTFSTRRETEILEQMRCIKPAAATYILAMRDVVWRGTSWFDDDCPLPPRYGIVTSNTSESVNSMFAEARDVGWLQATETIVDIMSTKISKCRQKYKECDGNEIVPRVAEAVKKRWDEAASSEVIELEEGLDHQFKIVDTSVGSSSDRPEDDDNHGVPLLLNAQRTIHILKPERRWCSCGMWQEYRYPCRHACAYFRKWVEHDLKYVLQHEVADCCSYNMLHALYTKNIMPVVMDSIAFDGVTKPPVFTQRNAGRPKKKRFRRRSELNELSPISCSICGERGHNRRTCQNSEIITDFYECEHR